MTAEKTEILAQHGGFKQIYLYLCVFRVVMLECLYFQETCYRMFLNGHARATKRAVCLGVV